MMTGMRITAYIKSLNIASMLFIFIVITVLLFGFNILSIKIAANIILILLILFTINSIVGSDVL